MKLIPLTQGRHAIVDDADYEWLRQWRWYLSAYGYAARAEGKRIFYMHREILGVGPGIVAHHRDEVRLNNRRSNLEAMTRAEHVALHQTGRKYSPEHCAGISAALKGRTIPAEARANMSEAQRRRWETMSDEEREVHLGCLRHGWTAESRAKQAASRRGRKHGAHTTSPYLGVSWFKRDSKWRAWINVGGRQRHLGYFHDEADAAEAYNAAALRHFGEYARLNQISRAA